MSISKDSDPQDILNNALRKIINSYFKVRSKDQDERFKNTAVKSLIPIRARIDSDMDSDHPLKTISPASVSCIGINWTICIHPALLLQYNHDLFDDDDETLTYTHVPGYVILYLMYHEAIHIFLGRTNDSPHGQTFLSLEEAFTKRERARQWLRESKYSIVENYS